MSTIVYSGAHLDASVGTQIRETQNPDSFIIVAHGYLWASPPIHHQSHTIIDLTSDGFGLDPVSRCVLHQQLASLPANGHKILHTRKAGRGKFQIRQDGLFL